MPLPTVILPGYLAPAQDYVGLQHALQDQGIDATIVPLRRSDWYVTLGGRPVTPILAQLAATIQQVCQTRGTAQVNLIGHSAGGWISRIYLGATPYCGQVWHGLPQVRTLVTLGTPHTSLERWTRSNLDFVNTTYPGAFYPQVNYVCVAGKAVLGQRSWQPGLWFTYQSYALTCGQGNCWGDGVTPIAAAHLAGAKNLVLDQVFHSPSRRARRRWYGSPDVVKNWVEDLG